MRLSWRALMSSIHSGCIECHFSLSTESPDKWRQKTGVCCDRDTGPRRSNHEAECWEGSCALGHGGREGGRKAIPGLNRTMARRQPSSVLSICMSRILDTSSVSTLQEKAGAKVHVRHVLTRAPPRKIHWTCEAQGRWRIAGHTGPGQVYRKEASP